MGHRGPLPKLPRTLVRGAAGASDWQREESKTLRAGRSVGVVLELIGRPRHAAPEHPQAEGIPEAAAWRLSDAVHQVTEKTRPRDRRMRACSQQEAVHPVVEDATVSDRH